MRRLSKMRMRLLMLFRRTQAAASLDNELHDHIERLTAENIASGMGHQEARFAALRSFGNPALLREQTRATWSWNGSNAFFSIYAMPSASCGKLRALPVLS